MKQETTALAKNKEKVFEWIMNKIKYYNKKNIKIEYLSKYNKVINFIMQNIDDSWKNNYKLGYETFGILLVGFCEWIHRNKEHNKIETIYFMARDGYIVKRAYNILYPDDKTQYMYISRRSLSLPSIHLTDNIDGVLDCMVLPPMFDIITFLQNINLTYDEVEKEVIKSGIEKDEIFFRSDIYDNKKIIELLKLIFEKIKIKAKEKYDCFNEYLNQLNFCGKIAVIDIGWHNSIQKNLINIVSNRDVNIYGYYLGIYDDAKRIEKPHSAEGFLYSYNTEKNRQIQTFAFVSLLESLFLAQEGTTITYKYLNKEVVPELAKYEYSEEAEMMKIIKEYQDGAIKFVEDFYNSQDKIEEITSDIASANIIKFGCNPKKEDLSEFEKINFENYKINNLVNFKHSNFYYITHPKKTIQDFYQSGWRIVYLRKLFVIPLPYFKIFKMICSIFNRR